MFATVSSAAMWGCCPRSAAVGNKLSFGRVSDCDCTARVHGGIREAPPAATGDDAPGAETLYGRLDAFLSREAVQKRQCVTGSASGIAFAPAEAALASDGALSLVLMGDPAAKVQPEHDDGLNARERVAWQLLDAYAACADDAFEKLQEQLVTGLTALSGSFSFVLIDRLRHRVVAARDRFGSQPLIWGMTADAALMFSSTSDSAISQAQNPHAFPAGCLFISDIDANAWNVFVRGALPGALSSFARGGGKPPMPRASSSSGGLCRIASGTDLSQITSQMGHRVPSFGDLAPAGMRGVAR